MTNWTNARRGNSDLVMAQRSSGRQMSAQKIAASTRVQLRSAGIGIDYVQAHARLGGAKLTQASLYTHKQMVYVTADGRTFKVREPRTDTQEEL